MTETIVAYLRTPWSLFVTSSDEIFVEHTSDYAQVDRWVLNPTRNLPTIFTFSTCSGVFVAIDNSLYCSQNNLNQVISIPLSSSTDTLTVVAGARCAGFSSDMLDDPRGIFVTSSLDLYVADCNNNRVQLFRSGETNATTVAGSGMSGNIMLQCPYAVTLDADGYLFIVDRGNNRIVGSGPNGFRCLVGCTGGSGSTADRLSNPSSFSFDVAGNLFVIDYLNARIQKFMVMSNECGKYSEAYCKENTCGYDRMRWLSYSEWTIISHQAWILMIKPFFS